jgi:hypothetical protein
MGLDVRLCTCTHQVKEEASLVKNATCEAYAVCMGLDVRLCTCTHLVKQEASLVKNATCELMTFLIYSGDCIVSELGPQ